MGDLDEAIRDHLELKRRRGTDAAEVARLEQEALGPVIRGEPRALAHEDPTAEPPPSSVAAEAHASEGAVPAAPASTEPSSEPTASPPPSGSAPAADVDDETQEYKVNDVWFDDDEA